MTQDLPFPDPTPGVQRSAEGKADSELMPQNGVSVLGERNSGGLEKIPPLVGPEEFARCVLLRQFRLPEVAVALQMDLSAVAGMMLDSEVAAHLGRLVATGQAAVTVAGPREVQERLSKIIRVTERQFWKEQGKTASGERKGSITDLWRTQIAACEAQARLLMGPEAMKAMRRKLGRKDRPVGKQAASIVTAEVVK